MPMLDVFNSDAFGLVEMVAALEKMPYQPGAISSMGLFESEGVPLNTVVIEEKDGILRLLPTQIRGGPATTLGENRGTARPVLIPHVPVEGNIYPYQLQGVREFGSDNMQVNLEAVRDRELSKHARSLDVTEEYHRLGALRGVVLDSDGSTPILDLFTFFDVSPIAAIDFDLAAATPAALAADIALVHRTVLDELTMTTSTTGYIGALCGDTFFDAFIERAEVKTAYDRWADSQALLLGASNQPGDFLRSSYVYQRFPYKNVWWINYRGNNSLVNNFIDPANAHFFPMDAPGLFRTFYGPSEKYMDTIGTMGRPRFSRAFEAPDGTSINIYSEMNDLQICMQPRVLLTGTVT